MAKDEIEEYNKKKNDFLAALDELRPDLVWSEAWSESEKDQVAELLRPTKMRQNMFASIPMICRGPNCNFADICPLQQKNLAPIGRNCPIEASHVHQLMTEYIQELEVDPNSIIEVSMVRDLVDQEIQQQRKTWLLSKEHFIQDNVIGVDSEGDPIRRKELHLAVELEDRIYKRKEKLRTQLLATRHAKAQAGQGNLNSTQTISNIMSQLKEIELAKEKKLKETLGIVDEYIQDAEIVEEDE